MHLGSYAECKSLALSLKDARYGNDSLPVSEDIGKTFTIEHPNSKVGANYFIIVSRWENTVPEWIDIYKEMRKRELG